MGYLKIRKGILESISQKPIRIGNIAPGIRENDVVTKAQLDAAGSSFVLIGAVTKDDVNANIGAAQFVVGDYSYNGKILCSVLTHTIEAFNVDAIGISIIDNITGTYAGQGSSVNTDNTIGFSNSDSAGMWKQQTNPESTFSFNITYQGKGTFAGGNTAGLINVYGVFVSLP